MHMPRRNFTGRVESGHWACALGLLVMAAGCGQEPRSARPEKKASVTEPLTPTEASPPATPRATKADIDAVVPPKPAVGGPKPSESSAKVDLRNVDFAGWEKVRAEHKGKWLAVDFWATWCVPCRSKYPKYVDLANKYQGGNIAFLTVSFDQVEDAGKAREFLAGHPGPIQHLLMTDEQQGVQEKLSFDGVPRYFLYDPAGKLVVNTDSMDKLAEALAQRKG